MVKNRFLKTKEIIEKVSKEIKEIKLTIQLYKNLDKEEGVYSRVENVLKIKDLLKRKFKTEEYFELFERINKLPSHILVSSLFENFIKMEIEKQKMDLVKENLDKLKDVDIYCLTPLNALIPSMKNISDFQFFVEGILKLNKKGVDIYELWNFPYFIKYPKSFLKTYLEGDKKTCYFLTEFGLTPKEAEKLSSDLDESTYNKLVDFHKGYSVGFDKDNLNDILKFIRSEKSILEWRYVARIYTILSDLKEAKKFYLIVSKKEKSTEEINNKINYLKYFSHLAKKFDSLKEFYDFYSQILENIKENSISLQFRFLDAISILREDDLEFITLLSKKLKDIPNISVNIVKLLKYFYDEGKRKRQQ